MGNNNQIESKATKLDEKHEEKNSNKNDKRFKYVYFIMTYDKSKQIRVFISKKYKSSNTLEKVNDKSYESDNGKIISDVYRFKIIEEDFDYQKPLIEYQMPINIGNDNYQYIIKLKDLKRDFYEYNFEIKELNILLLDYQKQFEIYVDILRHKYKKKQSTPENEDFIISIQSLLTRSDENYSFMLYISVFLECFASKYVNSHFLIFKPEKIKELGEIDDKKIKIIKNILNLLIKKPEKLNIENENERQKIIESFYFVAFYFNFYFQKERIKDMLENEQISEYLYDNLIRYNIYFEGLIIPEKDAIKLFRKSNDYYQVLSSLSYLGKDVIQFLKFINEEKAVIAYLFQKEKAKNKKDNNKIMDKKNAKEIQMINVENYICPKKEDDILQLNDIINDLIYYQKKNNISFIKFSYSFFEKYFDFNDGICFKNNEVIKNIIENCEKYDKTFKCTINLNELIHNNGVNLAKQGLLKNINLLEFIKTDIYFQDINYGNKNSIEIINGIDISSLENNFFYIWKSINFYQIFRNNFSDLLKKIASLIKEMKDFGLLFSFYDFYQDNDYKYESVLYMQKRYTEIFITYSKIEYQNFTNDTAKLIYWSDKKNVNLKKFLEDIQKFLDAEIINEIYHILIDKYHDLSKDIREMIDEFSKANMSLQFLLSNELIKEGEKIKSILDKIVKCDDKKYKAIPYDLGILLINNNLKEIQGLIYEASKKGLNKEETSEFVLNKFALTLPQDIIINMKINGLLNNKDKSFSKIIELYSKGEHSNFTNFLKTMNNYKNIIYAFSNNLEIIKNIDDINNELIGKISKENIKQIIISSIKSENDLEKELDTFFNDDNYKICLIKLMPYEGVLMNYLKYFIERKEKNLDEKNNSKKVFIFVVYMKRVMKKDLKSIDKMLLKEQIEIRKNIIELSLSHLSGYYQIAIDNLNGDDNLRIEKIINMKQTELFNDLVNLDEELSNGIFQIISYMNYNIITEYKGLNKDNYAEMLINFIYNNKRIRDLINKCIFSKSINKNEDIIVEIFKDKNDLLVDNKIIPPTQ